MIELNPIHPEIEDEDELHDCTMFEAYLRALCDASNLRNETIGFVLEQYAEVYYRRAKDHDEVTAAQNHG